MGYNSIMEIRVRIKKDNIQGMRNLIDAGKKVHGDLSKYFLQDIELNDDGTIVFEEYYCKHYGEDDFVRFIAPYAEDGDLEFVGDDCARWGYRFCGDGRVQHIIYIKDVNGFFIGKDKEED